MEKIDKIYIDDKGRSLLTAKNDYGEGKTIIYADFLMKKVKRLVTYDVENDLL